MVLLKRFHLNGNTIGFHPQTQKIELHTNQIAPCENSTGEFNLSGHTKGFRRKTQKLELHTKQIVPCERTA